MSKIKSVIIDYNMGNLYSLKCALDYINLETEITNSKKIINNSQIIFIPGVGSFEQAIKNLKKLKIYDDIIKHSLNDKTIIGICLGMQILFNEGTEGKKTEGLNLLNGVVKKFPSNIKNKLNVGWNNIEFNNNKTFKKINKNKKFYFIHSYQVIPKNKKIVTSYSSFSGKKFCSSVEQNNIIGFQFHPEKSSLEGIKILNNIKERVYEKFI